MPLPGRLRNSCFTINNYSSDDKRDLHELFSSGTASYVVYGHEIAPSSGTPHLQCYVEFINQISGKTLAALVPRAANIQPRFARKAVCAADYCKKDGDYVELGKISNQGSRKDLDYFRNLALTEGMSAVTRQGNFQQIRVAEKFLEYNEPKRTWKPNVFWFYGPTGTGKSRTAQDVLGENTYRKRDGSKWWQGYNRHENIIIDDFRDSWWSFTEMLDLLDRYPTVIETKGGSRQFVPRTIIVTSAFHPSTLYKGCTEQIDQLLRRIDHIEYFGPSVFDGEPSLTPSCTHSEVGGVIMDCLSNSDIEDILADLQSLPPDEADKQPPDPSPESNIFRANIKKLTKGARKKKKIATSIILKEAQKARKRALKRLSRFG